jgi:NitT/TauT family transport system substrate-binding protein
MFTPHGTLQMANKRISILHYLLIATVFGMLGCSNKQDATKAVTIAINPWPGYEFLHLAQEMGFFEQTGANIKLVQLDSLSDAQRAYTNDHVDGFATTLIEAVQAEPLGGKPLKVVLVTDYSHGGDVIIANGSISSFSEIKGKKVGCEVESLGIFVLARALAKNGLTLSDVEIVNIAQANAQNAFNTGVIDAFVTYPPVSINLLKREGFSTIFSSAEIPFEILDTVSISDEALSKNPQLVERLHAAWQLALDFTKKSPDEAYKIMADREGISVDEFKSLQSDLVILSKDKQPELFSQPEKLQKMVIDVCKTLVHADAISTDCDSLRNIIYRFTTP